MISSQISMRLIPITAVVIMLFFTALTPLFGQSSLLYLEAQGVAGYSNESDDVVFFSDNQMEAMQKPSLGFDLVQRVSNETRDFGVLAIQARMAYNATGKPRFEPQIYNAYFRYKAPVVDVWAGHNRPAQGLNYYLDSHGELLHNFAMHGLAFDRDWGVGVVRDFEWGDASVSYTTGSGMSLHFLGNHLLSARASYGVLSRDNYTVGLTYTAGKILNVRGVHLLDKELHVRKFAGADAAFNYRRLEAKYDFLMGEQFDDTIHYAFLQRYSLNMLPENRLKLEFQPVLLHVNDEYNYKLAIGVSYQLTNQLTLRSLAEYDHATNMRMLIFQLYFYGKLNEPLGGDNL